MLTLPPFLRPQPFRQPWRNLITVGRACDLLRADLLDHLSWLQKEVSYRYCRGHALFHEDNQDIISERLGFGRLILWLADHVTTVRNHETGEAIARTADGGFALPATEGRLLLNVPGFFRSR